MRSTPTRDFDEPRRLSTSLWNAHRWNGGATCCADWLIIAEARPNGRKSTIGAACLVPTRNWPAGWVGSARFCAGVIAAPMTPSTVHRERSSNPASGGLPIRCSPCPATIAGPSTSADAWSWSSTSRFYGSIAAGIRSLTRFRSSGGDKTIRGPGSPDSPRSGGRAGGPPATVSHRPRHSWTGCGH